MTDLEQDLTSAGFGNLSTDSGKTSGLRWIENGVGMYVGLTVAGGQITWETENKFYGADSLARAKESLKVWRLAQSANESTGCN